MTDRDRYQDGYARAIELSKIPHQERDEMSPSQWLAHPQNRPSVGDRDDFIQGYVVAVREIARKEGWTPLWPERGSRLYHLLEPNLYTFDSLKEAIDGAVVKLDSHVSCRIALTAILLDDTRTSWSLDFSNVEDVGPWLDSIHDHYPDATIRGFNIESIRV